jgi:hypothetical protein
MHTKVVGGGREERGAFHVPPKKILKKLGNKNVTKHKYIYSSYFLTTPIIPFSKELSNIYAAMVSTEPVLCDAR